MDASASQGTDVSSTKGSSSGLVGSPKAKERPTNIPVKGISKKVNVLDGNSAPEKLDEGKVTSSGKQRPQGKSSSNVRRMISAFEGGAPQVFSCVTSISILYFLLSSNWEN